MIKSQNFIGKNVVPLLFMLSAVIVFSSCLKNNNEVIQQPVSGIMAFNLAPSKSNIGFALSNSVITNAPIAYSNYTGRYVDIYSGSRSLEAFEYGLNNSLTNSTFDFQQGKFYSAFLVGDAGRYENVITQDNFDSLTAASNRAYVRFINAIPDSTSGPVVKITSGGTDVQNGVATYKTVSQFIPVAAGDVTVNITNESTITANRTISLQSGGVYTILLIGKAGSTNPNDLIQIKFIQNAAL